MSRMASLAGQLLIASPRMMDPNFARAVVLLVQDDENGSFGLILNRPLDVSLRDVLLKSLDEETEIEGMLYQGGPCEGPVMALHDDPARSQIDVQGEIYFTTERQDIESLLREEGRAARYFVGYAGWAAGQLESEIDIGSWLCTPAAAEQVLVPKPRQWENWVTILTGELKVSPDALPEDPSLN